MTQGLGPFSTYDAQPPVLPSGTTFNDCAKSDDVSELPLNPLSDPNSTEWNFMGSLLIAYAVVLPSAIVTVVSAAVTSSLSPVQAVNGDLAAFTVTNPTAGTTILEWTSLNSQPANQMLPPQRAQPEAVLTGVLGAHTYAISATYVTGPNSFPAVKVTTVVDGVLANLAATIGMQIRMY